MAPSIAVSDAVAEALRAGRPVVALETTLVTHGLPAADLARLADAPGVAKVNPGNLAAIVARGGSGSTTVAATLFAAAQTGIRVLATGGIGGVHRGADDTGDVSADLTALGRFPVAVVCAGAKAILDLPRTVEMLETLGVPVLGAGCDEFPAFTSRTSGLRVDARCDGVAALAAAIRAHFGLGLPGGVVVANPVPIAAELPAAVHDAALATALAEAAAAGVRGRDVTPFLLERMRVLTGGASLRANEALLLDNARLAAELATLLAQPA